jgi:hypothetical protein
VCKWISIRVLGKSKALEGHGPKLTGFAIIARGVARTHPLLQKDRPGDRINWKSTSLPSGSLWILPASIRRPK